MAGVAQQPRRQFRCPGCGGLIVVPWDLPPTRGPCPHCGREIESPAPPAPLPAAPPAAQAARAAGTIAVPMPTAPRGMPAPPPPAPPPAPLPQPLPAPERVPEQRVPEPVVAPAAARAAGVEAAPVVQPPAVVRPELPARPESPVPEPPRGEKRLDVGAGVPGPPARRAREPARAHERPGLGQVVAVVVAVLLVLGALAAAYWVARRGLFLPGLDPAGPVDEQREAEIRRARYLRVGWRDDARAALEAFLAASSVADKARWSVGGEALIPEMREFYGSTGIDDRDTPAAAFFPLDLRLEDRERGLFLMIYDLPPQFELGDFFRPLAPLEVQYGLEGPDMLLASFGAISDFVKEPVRVEAFFKQEADGMKVDWHLFVQTKHRLFRAFQCAPSPGRRGVFRVFVGEDVPDAGRGQTGTRTYRLDDPIHADDSVRVRVPVDSEVGRILSRVNWRRHEGQLPEARTATLELAWHDGEAPELAISRFICWEFLGLGGLPAGEDAAGE